MSASFTPCSSPLSLHQIRFELYCLTRAYSSAPRPGEVLRPCWLFPCACLVGLLEVLGWCGPPYRRSYEMQGVFCPVASGVVSPTSQNCVHYHGADAVGRCQLHHPWAHHHSPRQPSLAQTMGVPSLPLLPRALNLDASAQTPLYSYAVCASSLHPLRASHIHLQDLTSLVVPGIGGGMAADAVNKRQDPAKGGHVMLGGIVFPQSLYPGTQTGHTR
ncbi:hypothetical protein B0H10DRAFT_2071105 [Mycena sp. CBHHK59/15]|nr:hypothetical protein B0H10DRAFT_2071105 [Mycena sp. CBHHK59/15]